MRENWIKSFAKTGIIELIASKGDVYFYSTRSKDYDGRSTMYHVWDGGELPQIKVCGFC